MANEKITGQTAITEVLRLMKAKDNDLASDINTNATAITNIAGDVSNLTTRVSSSETNISANTTNITNLTTRVSTAEGNINTLNSNVGDLSNLTTTAKSSLVTAVNEVDTNTDLNTTAINTLNNTTIPTLSLKSETGYKLNLELDTTNYKLVAKLYTKDNTLLSTSDEIDFPIESMIVDASYDNTTKDLTFTLKNGTTIVVPLDDIIDGLATQADLDALEDRVDTAELDIADNANNIGNLNNLTTDAKTNLVVAINEVDAHADTNATSISNLTTRVGTAETNITNVDNKVGNLTSLTTDVKSDIVSAINEVDYHTDTNTNDIQTNATNIQTNTTNIGDLTQLSTTTKADLVSAINEIKESAYVTYTISTDYNTSTNALTTTLTDSNNVTSTATVDLSDLEEVEVGPTQPTDPNIKVWIDTSDDQVPYTLDYNYLVNIPEIITTSEIDNLFT